MAKKLPRKESLLPKDERPKATPKTETGAGSVVNPALQQVRDASEIALAIQKRVEAETKTKLLQKRYQSIEEGQEDVKRLREKAEEYLESAQRIENESVKLKDEAERIKQNHLDAYNAIRNREMEAEARMKEVESKSRELKSQAEQIQKAFELLNRHIVLYNEHITPCLRSLRKSLKLIYGLWDVLENFEQYDRHSLPDYISRQLNRVGKLTDRVEDLLGRLPEEIKTQKEE